ncbi:esterase-like activity of phytase family protein [Pseudooceanicola sp. 200-1SW]|uniref:esterase-like activity of phytase family protein n=1 Tax=Pseudooceanicola sp. 200-1SW TaxID=3425949 RepID=UPI003D7FB5CB
MRNDAPALGGLSAIEILDGGRWFVALSDAGALVEGRLDRDAAGRLTGARITARHPLTDPEGAQMAVKQTDPEGLALLPGGRLLVTFEHFTDPWIYDGALGLDQGRALPRPVPLTPPPDAPLLGGNSAYEAAAVDASGRLIVIPERPAGGGPRHPVWRLEADGWQRLADWPREAGFLPVGADVGPDGQLYVLERAFGLGFSGRIRRLDLARPGRAPELVAPLPRDRRANYEGLSVWTDSAGALRLTLVSDDNFTPLLRQQLLEFSLAEVPDRG